VASKLERVSFEVITL